ncbi:serine/threonine-protein kinase Nek11-like isoform X1 [Pecten maximus]|uniref:serine/threonine-protein kinase Nek11-like isoform X1 n=1 Tax=Pecten maximus TaxID=6579 RepID=UPI001457EE3B|nr:serine/threonine-protein kinase Nek11-like isoform X1 [Pecten maximus]
MSQFKSDNSTKKKPPRVLANRYEIVRKLGKGNFGTAYLCKDLRQKNSTDGSDLKVLKEISVGELQPDETVEAAKEARVLSKLLHPSIVKFHDSFIDGDVFCIITEFCEGGDLDMKINDLKKNKKQFDEKTVLDWFVQLVLAVHYMHTRRVLHRDLKTRNIFIKKNMIKIGDFGISRILMGTTDLASTFTGTPYYMSPEVLKHEGYNSKSDIWSIGCILYEMCTLSHAFDGTSLMGVMYKIVEGELPKLPDRFSKDLNRIMLSMLSKDPVKRPSGTDLLKEPLIANHIAKMSKDYQARHQENALTEAEEIARLLREKSHLSDLRLTEEEVKYKNLPPRERMRLRKMAQADEEAHRLKEVAKVQLIANQERKSKIKSHLNKTTVPAWQGGAGEGEMFKGTPRRNSSTSSEPESPPAITVTPAHFKTAPVPRYLADDAEDERETLKFRPSKTVDQAQLTSAILAPDERPITPLRDKMVYDVKHSSLDFRDGIPESPELADTYYSQYDDFAQNSDSDSNSGDENQLTVIEKNESTLKAKNSTVKSKGSDTVIGHSNDEDSFFNCLQDVLEQGDDAESTMTLADDMEAGAFGPVARGQKIKNLRLECEKMLGKEAFDKAYNYLKDARYNDKSAEEDIMAGLRHFVKNPSDCFLVDQLLFLEEQANLAAKAS